MSDLKLLMGDVDFSEPSLARTAAFSDLRDRKDGLTAVEVNALLDLIEDHTDELTSKDDVYELTDERNELAEQLEAAEQERDTSLSINLNMIDRLNVCRKAVQAIADALNSNKSKSDVRVLVEAALAKLDP